MKRFLGTELLRFPMPNKGRAYLMNALAFPLALAFVVSSFLSSAKADDPAPVVIFSKDGKSLGYATRNLHVGVRDVASGALKSQTRCDDDFLHSDCRFT